MTPQGNPSRTPPPHPGQSRITGVKQFSKPMKITKKKFVMGPDPNAGGSAIVKKEPNPAALNTNHLNPAFISAGRP